METRISWVGLVVGLYFMQIYLIGSLRNPEIPKIANKLREAGHDVFDDWYAAGEIADDSWRDYEKARGRTYEEALEGYAAKHVFAFDKKHLERCDVALLALPAGKSGHLELGWAVGRGKLGAILLDSPDRWDVMYQFADIVTSDLNKILAYLGPQYKFICTRCNNPILGDVLIGDGDGTGQRFAHKECYELGQ